MQRPYVVEMLVARRHQFVIDARTAEEAEDTASLWYTEGEMGRTLGDPEVLEISAVPADEGAMGEVALEHESSQFERAA